MDSQLRKYEYQDFELEGINMYGNNIVLSKHSLLRIFVILHFEFPDLIMCVHTRHTSHLSIASSITEAKL